MGRNQQGTGPSGGTTRTAAGLGIIAGLRGMTALATLSRGFAQHPRRRPRGTIEELLSSPTTARALELMAGGEMLVDKLPFTPPRIHPAPLAGRALIGALSGVALASYERRAAAGPALIGATAAIASSFAAYHLRRWAGERLPLPDAVLGAVEDGLVLALASRVGDPIV